MKIWLFLYNNKLIKFDLLPMKVQNKILLKHFNEPRYFITHSLIEEREMLKNKVYVIEKF